MLDILLDALLDSLKLLPFLFITFLFIELFEHKFSKKSKKAIQNSGKFGPVIGSLLGILPQCGFSVCATNFYITRIISLGTLFSVYLSTSDEMLPLLIAEKAPAMLIIKILIVKLFLGMIFGIIIDLFLRKKQEINYSICDHDHCDCKNNIFLASLKHTLNTFIFIFICTFLISIVVQYLGNAFLSKILLKDNIIGSLITCLIGLIPNCASSVLLTELFLNKAISIGALIGGLLSGSGVGLLVLFKENQDLKENLKILGLLYFIGSVSGIVIDLIIKLF